MSSPSLIHRDEDSKSPHGLPDWVRVWDDGHIEYRARETSWRGKMIQRKAHAPKQHVLKTGYVAVNCCIDGKKASFTVHRLVLRAFAWRDGCLELDANHKNGVRTDNRLSNLEWCTRSENLQHSYDYLGRVAPWKGRASPNKGRKYKTLWVPVIATCVTTGSVRVFDSLRSAVAEGFVSPSISRCLAGKKKTHRGFTWERAGDKSLLVAGDSKLCRAACLKDCEGVENG